jgi:outer membrane immunogenic protein
MKGIAMRKYSLSLLAAAAVGLTASMASAADLPRKAPAYTPPPPPPPITWTGCYIGANIGAIEGRVNTDFNGGNNFFNNNFNDNNSTNWGFAGGGQIGCDYQWAGGWVIGFRNMFDGTSLRRDRDLGFINNSFSDVQLHTRVNWFDTLTGRVGYSFTPNWMIYGQGGGAWANAEANLTLGNFASSGQSRTRSGWTAGGGVEWRFAPQWSAFLEGNYMDLGHKNVSVFDGTVLGVCGTFVGGCNFSPKFTASTVLVGVNYRFGGFGFGKAPY